MTIFFIGNDLTHITGSGISMDSTAGNFDPDYTTEASFIGDNAFAHISIPASTTDEVWVHADIKLVSTSNAQDGEIMYATDATGTQMGSMDVSNGNYRPTTNGVVGGNVTVGTTIRTWDIRFFADGTDSAVDFYLDGVLQQSNSQSGTNATVPVLIDLGGWDWGGMYISQIIISDTSFVGKKVGFLSLASAGADTDWTGGFAELDDRTSGAASSETAGDRVSSVPGAWGGVTTGTIDSVVLASPALTLGSGPASINHYVKIAATDYDGTAQAASSINLGQYTSEEYLLNPNTGVAWTFADLATFEAGLLSVA